MTQPDDSLLPLRVQALLPPLQGLLATSRRLREALDPASGQCQARDMELALLSMEEVLAAMLQAGDMPAPVEVFALPELLSKALAPFLEPALAKGIALNCELANSSRGDVAGSPLVLLQIVQVLVGDAVFRALEGEVRIHAFRPGPPAPGSRMAITITDPAPTPREPGILDIADPLVQALDGTLLEQRIAGRGSVCTIVLPLPEQPRKPERPARKAPAPRRATPRATRPRRILLVDDYPPGLLSLAEVLRLTGHEVVAARTGTEALTRHATGEFDVVLMDLHMPDMDGLQTTRLLRQAEQSHPRRTPVFAMTAYSRHAMPDQLDAAGMDGAISKPVELDELLQLLDSLD